MISANKQRRRSTVSVGARNQTCLFVSLFKRSFRTETHFGSDGTRLKMLKPGFEKIYRNKDRNRFKQKVKEEKDHGHSQQIKLNFSTVSLYGSRERKIFIQMLLSLSKDVQGSTNVSISQLATMHHCACNVMLQLEHNVPSPGK